MEEITCSNREQNHQKQSEDFEIHFDTWTMYSKQSIDTMFHSHVQLIIYTKKG